MKDFFLGVIGPLYGHWFTCSPACRCSPAGISPPALFLEDLAQSSRLTEGVPPISLVSLLSIGSGVGKLTLGVMVDIPWVDSVVLYALTVAASGLGVVLIPLTR